MLTLFWVVVALVAVLTMRNARYALRQYVSDRNRLILTLYFIVLFTLAFLVIHVTKRVIDLVQTAHDVDLLEEPMLPRAHRSSRLSPVTSDPSTSASQLINQ